MKNAIDMVNKLVEEDGKTLQKMGKGIRSMLKYHHLDPDVSKQLEDTDKYQKIISILIWEYELGLINILTEASVLYQNLFNPREGHLDAVFQIFTYLNIKRKIIPGELDFDGLEHPPYTCPIRGSSTEKSIR